MKKDFSTWLATMKDNIATWQYYTNFDKVYKNVESIKIELNILNSLIGSRDIEKEFKEILIKYPSTLKVIPILLAKRDFEIKINDPEKDYIFNFKKQNYSVDEYTLFMRKTGLFDLLENHIINNLVDYVTGVEVGIDTNGRKNRTGEAMENLVESYLIKQGLVNDVSYFKQMNKSEVEGRFNLNLNGINQNERAEKRFDFVIYLNNHVYACECNFYGSQGSKLNETARSYKTIALESKGIDNFTFVWITDGIGWNSAKHNLEETFDVMDTLYNINDLEEGALARLINQNKVHN